MGTRLILGGKEGSSKNVDVKTDIWLTKDPAMWSTRQRVNRVEGSALEGSKHRSPQGPFGKEQSEIKQRMEMWTG